MSTPSTTSGPNSQTASPTGNELTTAIGNLSRLLRSMLFFAQHLEGQLQAHYPSTPQASLLYQHLNNRLITHVPTALQVQTVKIAQRFISERQSKCPTPALLKSMLGEAAMAAHFGEDFTFERARERAKMLMAFPPEGEEADDWGNKILFNAIRLVGREAFATALTADQSAQAAWQTALVETIFSNLPLQPWPLKVHTEHEHKRRDFKSLVIS